MFRKMRLYEKQLFVQPRFIYIVNLVVDLFY